MSVRMQCNPMGKKSNDVGIKSITVMLKDGTEIPVQERARDYYAPEEPILSARI